MGDFRADIKITMHLCGKDYHQEWWINYWPESEVHGVDQRLIDWFRDSWDDAKARCEHMVDESQREQREKDTEQRERAELQWLKDLYEP